MGSTASADPARGVADRWLSGVVLLLATAFVLIGIGTPLLGTSSFAGSDLFLGKAPWNELVPTGFQPQNPYVGDTVDTNIPQLHAFAERFRDGDYASWWSMNTGGGELGSVPSDSVLSPLSLPYLLLPTWLAPGYSKLLEMAVAILGMVVFTRRIGLARSAGLLAGVVFVSSGFMVAWTNWPHTKVAAFVPLLFWAVERLVQDRRLGDLVPLGLVVAAMLLGGFPAVTAYALIAAAVYLLVRVVSTDRWQPVRLGRAALIAAGGVLVGFGIVAFQLIPFARELGAAAIGSRAQASTNHSPVESMITMVAPQALGGTNPTAAPTLWFGLGHPVEELSYLGAAALLLALIGMLSRRRVHVPPMVRAFFVVAALGTAMVIFLGGPLLAALQELPVFSTNRIGRARSMLGFFVAVLAALGFDALVSSGRMAWRSPARRWGWWAVAVTGCAAAVAGGLAVTRLARHQAFDNDALIWFDGRLTDAAVLGGIAAIGCVLAWRGRGVVRFIGLVTVPAIVVVQALGFVLPYWPRVAPDHFYPPTATHAFLTSAVDHDRVLGVGAALQTGTEGYYGVRSVGGRAFVSAPYAQLLRSWCDECFLTPGYMAVPDQPEVLASPLLDRLGTRFLVRSPASPIAGVGEVVGEPDGVVELAPGQTVTLAVPAGGLRGAGVDVAVAFAPDDPWATLEAVARDAGGTELARAERRIFGGMAEGSFVLPLAGLESAQVVRVDVTLDADRALEVRASGGQPVVTLVRPADDGLRVVHDDGAVVYERLSALSRIRWASTAAYEPDRDRAIDLVLGSSSAPEVVLSEPGSTPDGLPADLVVVEDSGDLIEVEVDAQGLGYLVVADGLQDRWAAEVDGQEVPLRDADSGYVAIEVPAGRHVVRLAYKEPLGGLDFAISGGAVLVLVAVAGLEWRRRRRSVTP